MLNNKTIRLFGIFAVISSLIICFSDILITYNPDPGNGGVEKEILDLFMLEFSNLRIYLGTFLGLFFIPFYCLGYYLIYKAIKPAGKYIPLIFLLISIFGLIFGFSQIHSSFGYKALFLKSGYKVSEEFLNYYKSCIKNILPFQMIIIIVSYSLSIFINSIIFIFVVIMRNTLYKKWMLLCNPLFIILLFSGLSRIFPNIFSILRPISVNFGNFIFFLTPTILLWNIKE